MSGIEELITTLPQMLNDLEGPKSLEALGTLRGKVVDLDLVEASLQVDSRTLSVLYLLKRLLHDIYGNLGTDASFAFPFKCIVPAVPLSIGRFAKSALYESRNGEAFSHLIEVIQRYYYCMNEVEKEIEVK
ncbi:MAG: hypothetical protein ABSF63_00285 [Candidatus Bathyarchaeia archaeon]